MTTFLLIRHATTDMVGRALAGREAGVHLNQEGIEQAELLAGLVCHLPVRAVYSSPLERAMETAGPLAQRMRLDVLPREELNEFDMGDWTGSTFDEMAAVAAWAHFNTFRSGTRVSGGESMLQVQSRVISLVELLFKQGSGDLVALVSHADVIRAALLYYLGMPLDLFARLEISPASVSVLEVADYGARVLSINNVAGRLRVE